MEMETEKEFQKENHKKENKEIQILSPGALTTVQDYGRIGYGDRGFSPSGAVDKRAMEIANLLVGNRRGEAVIESTLMGPMIEFHGETVIAMMGADMQAKLSGVPVQNGQAIAVHDGDLLQFSVARTGCRNYLAIAGGLELPEVLGSKSLYQKCGIGGGFGRALQAGDCIPINSCEKQLMQVTETLASRNYEDTLDQNIAKSVQEVCVILGPQEDYFTASGIRTFLGSPYRISNDSNRMACKLSGEKIESKGNTDIISDGIALGAIQVSSNGQPIVMLTDRQTTGGYAKIATVISTDISILAQCKPGDQIAFREVTLKEAHRRYQKQEKRLRGLEKKLGLAGSSR